MGHIFPMPSTIYILWLGSNLEGEEAHPYPVFRREPLWLGLIYEHIILLIPWDGLYNLLYLLIFLADFGDILMAVIS